MARTCGSKWDGFVLLCVAALVYVPAVNASAADLLLASLTICLSASLSKHGMGTRHHVSLPDRSWPRVEYMLIHSTNDKL
jgi:hypothetical protein